MQGVVVNYFFTEEGPWSFLMIGKIGQRMRGKAPPLALVSSPALLPDLFKVCVNWGSYPSWVHFLLDLNCGCCIQHCNTGKTNGVIGDFALRSSGDSSIYPYYQHSIHFLSFSYLHLRVTSVFWGMWERTHPGVFPHQSELLVCPLQVSELSVSTRGIFRSPAAEPPETFFPGQEKERWSVSSTHPTNWFSTSHNDQNFPAAKVQTVGDADESKTIEHDTEAPYPIQFIGGCT